VRKGEKGTTVVFADRFIPYRERTRVAMGAHFPSGNACARTRARAPARLQHGIELGKLDAGLKPQNIFKYEGVNDIELWDFSPLEGVFVLSGSVRVQLPTTLLREVIPLE
jgi:hypothetical protein